MSDSSLYNPNSVRLLFDEMAKTYGFMNLVTSFGFAVRWRRQSIALLPPTVPFHRVADLMSGMGELWRSLARHTDKALEVVAVDISPEMTRRAPRSPPFALTLCVEDVFLTQFEPASFDAVVCSFGLKTLSPDQQSQFAQRIAQWLRPDGVFSFVEISVPSNPPLRLLYMFYLKLIIPLLGRIFLGNPDNYRMLGTYTQAFGNCRHFSDCLRAAGLEPQFISLFFGCATAVIGRKPAASQI